jgi:hypothetical protein
MRLFLKITEAAAAIVVLPVAWCWWTLAHTYEIHSHNMHGAVGNVVYLHVDGHKEAVFDHNGNPVTDPANQASYNYCDPVKEPFCHFAKDTFPWLLWGNAPNDPTTGGERFAAFWSDYKDGVRRSFGGSE